MRRRYVAIGAAATLLAAGTGAALVHGQPAPATPFPPVTIPGVPPTGNCCLWQIHKKAQGERRAQFGDSYNCDTGKTARGATQIRLRLASEGAPCDQGQLIPNNSLLEATGSTIRRADGFAHFFGKFSIRNPAGAVLFSGTMEAMDRIGTHHPPFGAEVCNPQGHLEGWLVGRSSAALPNHTLRALIVARASLPIGAAAAPVTASMDGVLMKCP